MPAKRHGNCQKCDWSGPCEAGVLVEHGTFTAAHCGGSGLLPVGGEPITPEELVIETRERFLAETDISREVIYPAKVLTRWRQYAEALRAAGKDTLALVSYYGDPHKNFYGAMQWSGHEREDPKLIADLEASTRKHDLLDPPTAEQS